MWTVGRQQPRLTGRRDYAHTDDAIGRDGKARSTLDKAGIFVEHCRRGHGAYLPVPLSLTRETVVAEQVNTAPDYGWRDSEPVPSQTYLAKPVVKWLKQVQARRVLDLGCGNGAMSHYLQRQGFYVVGCDVDERGVEEASKGASGAVFTQVGVYDPPELLGETGFDRRGRQRGDRTFVPSRSVTSLCKQSAETGWPLDRHYALSRLCQEPLHLPGGEMGPPSRPLMGRRAYQVLLASHPHRLARA